MGPNYRKNVKNGGGFKWERLRRLSLGRIKLIRLIFLIIAFSDKCLYPFGRAFGNQASIYLKKKYNQKNQSNQFNPAQRQAPKALPRC